MRRMMSMSFPLGIPALACVLGIQTMASPWLVLAAGLIVAAVVWWMMLRVVLGHSQADVASVASVCLSLLGGVYSYMAGLVIGKEGALPLAACLIAFSAGLISGVLERRRARSEQRLVTALKAADAGSRSDTLARA